MKPSYLFSSYYVSCSLTHTYTQEFAKVVEPENVKRDLITMFHNLAGDDQVKQVY